LWFFFSLFPFGYTAPSKWLERELSSPVLYCKLLGGTNSQRCFWQWSQSELYMPDREDDLTQNTVFTPLNMESHQTISGWNLQDGILSFSAILQNSILRDRRYNALWREICSG